MIGRQVTVISFRTPDGKVESEQWKVEGGNSVGRTVNIRIHTLPEQKIAGNCPALTRAEQQTGVSTVVPDCDISAVLDKDRGEPELTKLQANKSQDTSTWGKSS